MACAGCERCLTSIDLVRARLQAALALVVLVAGCGGSGTRSQAPGATPEPPLTAAERDALRNIEARLQRHCVRVARSLVDPQAAPLPRQQRAAFAAADRLVALAARSPRAPLGAGQDLRLFLSDTVENLEGSNCDAQLLARLEAGLARIAVE